MYVCMYHDCMIRIWNHIFVVASICFMLQYALWLYVSSVCICMHMMVDVLVMFFLLCRMMMAIDDEVHDDGEDTGKSMWSSWESLL